MACAVRSRAIKGWLAGCGASAAALYVLTLAMLATGPQGAYSIRFVGVAAALLFPIFLVFVATCVLTGVPAAAVIWLSERWRIRSVFFFGGTGAAIGAFYHQLLLRPAPPWLLYFGLLVVAGIAGGAAYWRVAGRYAGSDCAV